MKLTGTIVALATPPLNGAIHIIRVSGTNAFSIVNSLLAKPLVKKGHTVELNQIIENQQQIDEALFVKFVAPRSYTGEDLIEINVHGSLHLARLVIELLIKKGANMAEKGEFTARALLAQKIDLPKAEAIALLCSSQSSVEVEAANNALTGKLSERLINVRQMLLDMIARIEVDIDYPEYDDHEKALKDELLSSAKKLINNLQDLIDDSKRTLRVASGLNVTIIGAPNAGKSSMLNALAGQEKAIVSSIPGTTRDIVEVRL
ncbi:unnamed protein product [Didymodactylos carnosus]|uniref:tRNA uridine-5-carboxymethylaminomethyl(34) synthesis GTPase MnmE n=1 Tax=Didymodactylos carnosus TaxID=1234261 RepID=A0A8S2CS57_9BILA|nr:unnamed protein product [Didymodactylos carnosus]CAF3499460.1 unnamed protein product [Didymodactylos carnosus]